MIARNAYIKQIKPFIDQPIIKVITGIRRCGKSTFLKLIGEHLLLKGISEESLIYINKESIEFRWLQKQDQLEQYVLDNIPKGGQPTYLFLDEIQEIEGWEKAISGLLADKIADIYITGSNSRMLSSELATYITGRFVEINMFPLTFSEFLTFRSVESPAEYETEFNHYLKYGGFPGIHTMELESEAIFQYERAIFESILYKDVVTKNSIRDVAVLDKLSRYLADNSGNITSAKNISDFLKSQKSKSTVDTIQSYISMLTAAYIYHKVRRYDIKGKRWLEIYEKYYPGDIGIKNILTGYKPEDISGLLENIIFLELRSRGYHVGIGKIDNLEIDFIATKNNFSYYIQVSYLLQNQSTIEREFGVLEKVDINFPKIVLSLDKHISSHRDGIYWFNIIDFLTKEELFRF